MKIKSKPTEQRFIWCCTVGTSVKRIFLCFYINDFSLSLGLVTTDQKQLVIIWVFYGYDDIHQLKQKRGKTKTILEIIDYDMELLNIGFFELSVEVC